MSHTYQTISTSNKVDQIEKNVKILNLETKTDDESLNTLTHFECVGQFHEVFDYPVRTESYLTVFTEDSNLLQSRISFLREEKDEFLEALENKDMVEMADALCDLIYFAHGTGQCLGINLDTELGRTIRDGFDITHCPKDLSTTVDPHMIDYSRSIIDLKLGQIINQIDGFELDCKLYDFNRAIVHLTEITRLTYELGYYMHFDMDAMFREVHRSNMTKVCLHEEDAQESLKCYLESKKYEQPVIRTKGDYFLIYDEKLNKILKSHKWEQPNLKQFMGSEYDQEQDHDQD